jgi:hypothetical protein
MIDFTNRPEVTRYCSACSRILVPRVKWNGHYDQYTGEPKYDTELKCPFLLVPLLVRLLHPRELIGFHDTVQVWEPPQLENRPVSRPYVPPSEDTR